VQIVEYLDLHRDTPASPLAGLRRRASTLTCAVPAMARRELNTSHDTDNSLAERLIERTALQQLRQHQRSCGAVARALNIIIARSTSSVIVLIGSAPSAIAMLADTHSRPLSTPTLPIVPRKKYVLGVAEKVSGHGAPPGQRARIHAAKRPR
jgi:precorrin isomerase